MRCSSTVNPWRVMVVVVTMAAMVVASLASFTRSWLTRLSVIS